MQLIECVPNISEGRNKITIDKIVDVIETVEGVKLLNVDPGKATNRTVITFVGEPNQVIEAAFLLIQKAQELINMSLHQGEHPRMGAVDVCPLIPISNISMEETIEYAHKLSERVGNELGIPVYCYENSAKEQKRINLSNCRSGEYEGLAKKIITKEWKPDYGPNEFNNSVVKSGVTAISARDFLIAYNVNLNSTSSRRANAIAFDLREAGRIKREGDKISGKILKDKNGDALRQPGIFKNLKGIGWFIEEYGIAQISYNLTNINVTSLHDVFEKTCERATARGLRVTGSELIGLVPKKVLVDAGKYFLKKQSRSLAIPDREIIHIAVKTLGLDELQPFNQDERIIEYALKNDNHFLANMSLIDFANKTSSESPAPGGGSISAYCGVLGAALSTMVANLSANKRGWDDKWEFYSKWGEQSLKYQNILVNLVDEDTRAFNNIMSAVSLPNDTKEQKLNRSIALQSATINAIEIPFKIMETAFACLESIKCMTEHGNPNSISDAGVAALCIRTAVMGAYLNVKINCKDLQDKNYVSDILKKGRLIVNKTNKIEFEILAQVDKELN
ncbi:glutamate formimidoyltransferase [Flavobacteriaceae bacterium]|jgi:glutamate formiminotransferase / formiminotetrahydrofolate cyclodeaminase|nr:glutamate formimidoyltransferase [Flavobacteriaceae bacterium]MDC1491936.1 glutamate formimidoyltransferase [Flavobacteriaceae bacterium]MDC1534952.1 glutamate formimidoyltransferase [Flavobacteriaceae bacterium]